jgi:tRNA pseudouridine38-40 synthase
MTNSIPMPNFEDTEDDDPIRDDNPNLALPTKKYRMTIAYDGTIFSGWQVQIHDQSIQGLIEQALHTILREQIRVVGAGRTDAGVHAMGQSAHFRIQKELDIDLIKRAMNGVLPPQIRILELCPAPLEFHAQRSAIGKEYHYHLCLQDVVLPFERPYVWHCRRHIDFDLLEKASRFFIGEHDFKGFANAPGRGSEKKTSVRTIRRLDIIRTQSGLRLEFEGNGFLYKMVRNITGMLVSVSCSKRKIEEIEEIFLAKDRRLAEPAAPPQGLFLKRVFYPDWVFENSTLLSR